jgi:hypothetical protein
MALCGVAVLFGVVCIVRWGGMDLRPAPESPDVYRRYVWYVAIAVLAGIGAGFLMAGPGGRLVMRLLAVTAGDDAQGRLTEAEETVGRITTGGTIGLVIFTGLFFGITSGFLYLVVHRWLPHGRLRGLAFGSLLFVVGATQIDPLRKDNPDFDIVGPGWLALVAFAALVLLHGMVVAALAARVSHGLPLLGARPRALIGHAPLLLLLPIVFIAVPLVIGAGVAGVIARRPDLMARLRSRQVMIGGWVVLAVVALVTLPGAVSAVVDIAGRGP